MLVRGDLPDLAPYVTYRSTIIGCQLIIIEANLRHNLTTDAVMKRAKSPANWRVFASTERLFDYNRGKGLVPFVPPTEVQIAQHNPCRVRAILEADPWYGSILDRLLCRTWMAYAVFSLDAPRNRRNHLSEVPRVRP